MGLRSSFPPSIHPSRRHWRRCHLGRPQKRDLDIITFKPVPFAMDLDELCLGRISNVHLSSWMDRGKKFKTIYHLHYLESTDSKDVRECGLPHPHCRWNKCTSLRKSVCASFPNALRIQSEEHFAHPLKKLPPQSRPEELKLGNQIRGKLMKEFCANANFRLHEPHFPSANACCRKSGLIKETMRLLSKTLDVLLYVVFR